MNKEYVIYTDVSADVDAGFVKDNGVGFVPMHYTLGQEDRICHGLESEELLKKFYDGQRTGDMTRTSQITPQTYIDQFEPILKEGKDVLYLSLSSGLTKTFDSASLAAMELAETCKEGKFVPVDSLCATGGMGLLVESAYQNQKAGMTIEENAQWLNEHAREVCHWFKVEDLMYLKRGGRIPATTAVIGTALNIKPILEIDSEGKLITIDKKRGTKLAVKALLNKYLETRDPELGDRVYIVHADCLQDADLLESMVKEANPKAVITKMMLSSIIGAHTGPGMMALIHYGKTGSRS